MTTPLSSLIRSELLHLEGVRRLPAVRRSASVLTNESARESLYFLDSGFAKSIRRGDDGKEVILSIIGPGELFAEHALLSYSMRPFISEMLEDGVVFEIPKVIFMSFCRQHPEVWQMFWEQAIERQMQAEQKIALLCLEDVEFRILYYLAELGHQFAAPATNQEEYSVPLSQSELASLVGATRETTSTTLNALARQGLVRLSRRLVTVRSLDAIRNASRRRGAKAASQSGD